MTVGEPVAGATIGAVCSCTGIGSTGLVCAMAMVVNETADRSAAAAKAFRMTILLCWRTFAYFRSAPVPSRNSNRFDVRAQAAHAIGKARERGRDHICVIHGHRLF